MNHQLHGLLWNVHCVATVVLRKQLNFKSAVIRSIRSSCFIHDVAKQILCHDSVEFIEYLNFSGLQGFSSLSSFFHMKLAYLCN